MGHPGSGSHRGAAPNSARLSGDHRHRRTTPHPGTGSSLRRAIAPLRSRHLSRRLAVAVYGGDVRRAGGLRARPQTRDSAARIPAARLQFHHRRRRDYQVRDNARSISDGIRARAERSAGQYARHFFRVAGAVESDLPPGADFCAIAAGALGIHASGARGTRRGCDRDDGAGGGGASRCVRQYQELRGARQRQAAGAPRGGFQDRTEDFSGSAQRTAGGVDHQRSVARRHPRCRRNKCCDRPRGRSWHRTRFAGAIDRASARRQHRSHRRARLSEKGRTGIQAVA